MRLVFMGTPDFSVPALNALVDAGHEVLAVYTQPPRAAGRGKKARPTAVHARAKDLGLSVHTPLTFKDQEVRKEFAALNADIAVVVAYGLILPVDVLNAPQHGCLNIHASLLPRWRGAAPIHRAIMAGDDSTGVCIMQMEAGLDTGRVLLRKEIAIEPSDTTGSLHDRLATMGASAIVEALEKLDVLVPEDQPKDGVTYAAKIEKSEARIDWSKDAGNVDNHIRGLSPFPGAWFEYAGERIKVLHSEMVEGQGVAGTVLDDALTVACGQNAVRLLTLQRAGKGAMTSVDFLNGLPIRAGIVLK
ncbi:MAG: methionyl-tRNA formyltransferase [Pseudomonadota bacterium]